ncbi:MAG: ABC transporter permease, partial [Spirochaetia bacterium]|nr:ABC transporter permease [Spirochaetia bacterium]
LHLGRRILVPLSGVLLSDFSSFLAGAVVVEEIFAFPGIGRVIFQSIQRMDLRLLGFLIFYVGLLIHLLNVVAERVLLRGAGEEKTT